MSNSYDKNEIQTLLSKYKYNFDLNFSKDKGFQSLLSNISEFENSERPDVYYIVDNYCYAIEHFQVSQYRKIKGNQDISKKATGSKEHREKVKEDISYDFASSITNLINAIDMSLSSHSKSFNIYFENACKKYPEKEYRLIIFIEDSTESAYIVKKCSNNYASINPLCIKEIAELLALIAFKVQQRLWQKKTKCKDTVDYQYWQKNGWLKNNCSYYIPNSANFLKVKFARLIGSIVAVFFE